MHVQFYEGYLLQTLECYWPSFAIWSPVLAYVLTPQPRPFHLHPCCTWKKIRGFQVVHNRYLHQSDPTISKFILHGFLPKHIHGGSLKQWTKKYGIIPMEVIYLEPHISIINDPWIFPMGTDPAPEISETPPCTKKNTTIEKSILGHLRSVDILGVPSILLCQ